ncbi:MAG: hypothetical protein AAGB31_05885 [Bdellovibrio sp.]
MKKSILSWTLSVLLFLLPALSWSLPPIEGDEVQEWTLESSQVVESEKIRIDIGRQHVYELAAFPDREVMKKALRINTPAGEESNPLEAYETMTDEEKKEFREARREYLQQTARILHSTRFVYGVGSLTGDVLRFVKNKVKGVFTHPLAETTSTAPPFRERSQKAVQSILESMDYKLWSQAPLVAESNEIGMMLVVGVLAETGLREKGFGGVEEIGLSLAFNRETKAAVFEIFHNSEVYQNTVAAVGVVGISAKVGLSIASREGAETLRGSTFYPPLIPGYSSISSNYFSAGFGSSLGLPPPPIADFMTFTNKFERRNFLRVMVSPLYKGFVRAQVGDVVGSVRLVVMRVVNVGKTISHKVHQGLRACAKALL